MKELFWFFFFVYVIPQQISLQYKHKFRKNSHTYIYNWYCCRGIGTYFTSMSTDLNPGIGPDTWSQYWPQVSLLIPDLGISTDTWHRYRDHVGIRYGYWYRCSVLYSWVLVEIPYWCRYLIPVSVPVIGLWPKIFASVARYYDLAHVTLNVIPCGR